MEYVKELKRMSRMELIDIISQYQQLVQELTEQNTTLQKQLDERRICLENAGSIAEAALALNNIFATAQQSADQYLAEVARIQVEANRKAGEIVTRAEASANAIRFEAERTAIRMKQEATEACRILRAETGKECSAKLRAAFKFEQFLTEEREH